MGDAGLSRSKNQQSGISTPNVIARSEQTKSVAHQQDSQSTDFEGPKGSGPTFGASFYAQFDSLPSHGPSQHQSMYGGAPSVNARSLQRLDMHALSRTLPDVHSPTTPGYSSPYHGQYSSQPSAPQQTDLYQHGATHDPSMPYYGQNRLGTQAQHLPQTGFGYSAFSPAFQPAMSEVQIRNFGSLPQSGRPAQGYYPQTFVPGSHSGMAPAGSFVAHQGMPPTRNGRKVLTLTSTTSA